MPRILKEAGWDFILIDTEHASFGIDTVATLLHVSSAIGLPALVRVPETQRSLLSRPLDAGAMGSDPLCEMNPPCDENSYCYSHSCW